MKILFINYWGLNDGLTQSTTIPNLQYLNDNRRVSQIVLITIERMNENLNKHDALSKVIHIPIFSTSFKFGLLNKLSDFIFFPKRLHRLCDKYKIDKIIARGAHAGGIAWLVYRLTNIPFVVESFEPHAEYMLSSNTWKRYGLKYIIQKILEKKQERHATGLVTVTKKFHGFLLAKGLESSKLSTAPCAVNPNNFFYDESSRNKIRKQIGCTSQTILGVYMGKFGDIYYKEEVIPVFETAFRIFSDFHLMILTPQQDEFTDRLKNKFGNQVSLMKVPHNQVSCYLSAADMAFATIREHPIRAYCCPIKTGEYWACGLPVLISKDIGDDSEIIEDAKLGATFSIVALETIDEGLLYIKKLMNKKGLKNEIRKLAILHRSFKYTQNAYEKFIFNKN